MKKLVLPPTIRRCSVVQTISVVPSFKNDKCPCRLLSMLPHHKGVFTAEVMAELSLSCIRKKGVLKSWLRVGCGGKENQPPTPASPWSQSSRRAGVRDPATKQQPLAAALLSSPAPSILVSPRLPRIAVRRRPISLLSLPMPPLAVCYPKHLPTLYRPRADLQKS